MKKALPLEVWHVERRNSKVASAYTFWLILQNYFCSFFKMEPSVGLYMIKPSIESSDILFWHEKNLKPKFCEKQTK